jgi:hypothetical protein
MILETDGEANIEDGFVRDLQLVSGLFQSKPVHILLRRLTYGTGKDALEVKGGVTIFQGQRP